MIPDVKAALDARDIESLLSSLRLNPPRPLRAAAEAAKLGPLLAAWAADRPEDFRPLLTSRWLADVPRAWAGWIALNCREALPREVADRYGEVVVWGPLMGLSGLIDTAMRSPRSADAEVLQILFDCEDIWLPRTDRAVLLYGAAGHRAPIVRDLVRLSLARHRGQLHPADVAAIEGQLGTGGDPAGE